MNLDKFKVGKYKLVENEKHGYIHVLPLPSDEELKEFYDKYLSVESMEFNSSALQVQKKQAYYTNSRWEMIYNKLCCLLGNDLKKKSLIDIGCGFAQAMMFFKNKDIEVIGVEPSKIAVEYGINNGLNIVEAEIEKFLGTYSGKKYEVVTMIEVLEHLREPEKILQDIKTKLISEKGILVVEVPNDFNEFQLIANEKYKLNNWWVCPPEHINYFSVDSLRKTLTNCGYEILYEQASFPLEIFMLMGEIYIGNDEYGAKCHENRVNFERTLKEAGREDLLNKYYESLAALNLGRSITVFAKIKNS